MAAHLPLGQGRLRPCPGAARLAYDFAQVPVTYALGRPVGGSARVSCIAFDAAGELIAAGTAGGRVGVQQVEQYMPSALRATSSALDADGRALCFRPSDETRPLIEFETQRALTALRWRPGLPNQFAAAASAPIGGGGGGSVVLIYDLASSCPRRPTRRCLADASQGLLHDILFCDVAASAHPGCTLVGGGRDGQLVVWDMRCDAPVLRPASTATSGFTLGKRSRDFGTGSVSALAHAQFGTAVCAGTSDGSLLVWDVRCLRSVVSCTRVNRGAASGVDSVLPHPRVGRVMVAQLSDGSVCVIDTEAGERGTGGRG
jgi:WD40 repeat protein